MATPATINTWLDDLSSSILAKRQDNSRRLNARKLQDVFRRRVRKHGFGRTNQFEVENRLDGLEEKFQILSLDNLSDALRSRRLELKPFENHWLPDILDLFLHLSGAPAANQTLLELYRIPPRIGTPPPLKWNDLLADSPIDYDDNIWRIPDLRDADDSGYDDERTSSGGSVTTSPYQLQRQSSGVTEFQASRLLHDPMTTSQITANVSTEYWTAEPRHISESQFIRQSLFFLRGYDTHCFTFSERQFSIASDIKVYGISHVALNHFAKELSWIRQCLAKVVSWTSILIDEQHISAMQYAAEEIVQSFYRAIDCLQKSFTEIEVAAVVTLSSTLSKVYTIITDLKTVADLLGENKSGRPTVHLQTLYDAVQDSQLCADTQRYACLIKLLRPALSSYLTPVIKWMVSGKESENTPPVFIEVAATNLDPRKIWNARFRIAEAPCKSAPKFVANTVNQILACGKTSALLNELHLRLAIPPHDPRFTSRYELPSSDHTLLPFTQAFEHTWQQFVENCLHQQTIDLKSKLSRYCNFGQTLNSIQQLYFPHNSSLMHEIEIGIFDRIDRCIDSWNDRFQLKDILEDAFAESEACSLVDSVAIHSAYISSRTIRSQRISVKILSSLSFEYVLSWPVANIISDDSMTSYRRIALVLMQIRRAKYTLERTGYVSAVSIPLGSDAGLVDQTFAQALAFTLLTFVNTLFDSMMLSSIWPATAAMQTRMWDAQTMDEMIGIHHIYIKWLECSCLAAPRLSLLRQSLISILDLCIRFSDLVSNPSKLDHEASDHEASSFISAKSRNKSLRIEQYGSDDENEDDDYSRRLGDGYSSFIVLDDDTSIVNELRKVKSQYEKQVKFLISGLRGVSKGGPDTVDLNTLAERLSWLTAR